jgi:hypothetical protein
MIGPFRPLLRGLLLAAVVAGALALLAAEWLYLHLRQQEHAAAWADQVVAARVEAAEAHLARRDWDKAIGLLQTALEVDGARNREVAQAALLRARRGQAGALLEAARGAVAAKDVARALALLKEYRAHPQAPDPDAAACLQADLDRATDDASARVLLENWSDTDLAFFAAGGRLGKDMWSGDRAAEEVFKDTLRRHLPAEQARREARREAQRREEAGRAAERARQEARLRGTPLFRDLLAFLADVRWRLAEEDQLARRQEQALAQLFAQLNVTDQAERERLRATFTADRRAARKALAEAADRKRAETKQAFRRLPDCKPADAEVFDRLVDGEEGERQ